MRQLEFLATPPKEKCVTAGSAKAKFEENSLRNHLIRFEKIYPYGLGEPKYRLQIAAELPGYFHYCEAEQIIESTSLWRWGEPDSLGRLGVLIENAIALSATKAIAKTHFEHQGGNH